MKRLTTVKCKGHIDGKDVNNRQLFSPFYDESGIIIEIGDTIRYKNKKGVFKYVKVIGLVAKAVIERYGHKVYISKYITGITSLNYEKVTIWRVDKVKLISKLNWNS